MSTHVRSYVYSSETKSAYGSVHRISVFIAYAQKPRLNAHAGAPTGTKGLNFDFIYIQTLFMRAAKALVSLRTLAVPSGHSLLDNAISVKIVLMLSLLAATLVIYW